MHCTNIRLILLKSCISVFRKKNIPATSQLHFYIKKVPPKTRNRTRDPLISTFGVHSTVNCSTNWAIFGDVARVCTLGHICIGAILRLGHVCYWGPRRDARAHRGFPPAITATCVRKYSASSSGVDEPSTTEQEPS